MMTTSVTAGPSGPVIVLVGEADLLHAEQLSGLISVMLDGELTIDMSRLTFADSAAIRTLLLADREMKQRGGQLVLLSPQQQVARVLAMIGADQVVTIRDRLDPSEAERNG